MPIRQKLYLILSFLTPVAITLVLLFLHYVFNISYTDANDLTNLTATVIEVGLGAGITVSILMYSNYQQSFFKKQQDEIANLLKRIETIEQNQQQMIDEQHTVVKKEHQRIERWKKEWGEIILADLEGIVRMYDILENWLIQYKTKPSSQQKSDIISSSDRLGGIVDFYVQNILKYLPKIENSFDDPSLGVQLIGISDQLSAIFKGLHMDYHWEPHLDNSFQIITEMKRILAKDIVKIKKEIP